MANIHPNLLGKTCDTCANKPKPDGCYDMKDLQVYKLSLGVTTAKQSFVDVCSALRAKFIELNIDNQAQLEVEQEKKVFEFCNIKPTQPTELDLSILLSTDSSRFRFDNLNNYLRNIKPIGDDDSANGFIRKLQYSDEFVDNCPIIQKNSLSNKSDSLVYEYLIGQCINELSKYYPCFSKTYSIGKYVDIDNWNLFKSIKSAGELSMNLSQYIERIDTSDLDNLIIQGCRENNLICIFTQYIPIWSSLKQFINSICKIKKDTKTNTYGPTRQFNNKYSYKLYTLVSLYHMIYSCLSTFSNVFTHYDLHGSNIVIIKIPNNQYVEINLHMVDGSIVSYKTDYLPVIIDYGRCFVDCDGITNEIHNSFRIRKKVCDYDSHDETIPSEKRTCVNRCGDQTGYDNTTIFDYEMGRFIPNEEDKYYVDSARSNISHDLRILYELKLYNIDSPSNFIENELNNFLQKINEKDSNFGERENLDPSIQKIYNVHSAFTLLNNIVSNQQFNTENDIYYSTKKLYKTIHIWHGQPFTNMFNVV